MKAVALTALATLALSASSARIVLLEQSPGAVLTVEGDLDESPSVQPSAYRFKPGQHWIAHPDGSWSTAIDPAYCLASDKLGELTLAACADPRVLHKSSLSAARTTPFVEKPKAALNTSDRAAVLANFNNQYVINNFPLSGWDGNIAGCVPGNVSAAFRALTLQRVNYFRDMAGVPLLTLDDAASIPAQAGALVTAATSAANFAYPDAHNPPANAPCFTQTALDGTSTSNIWTSTRGGPDNIDGMIFDAIAGSAPDVGHRTLVLQPTLTAFGTGDAPIPDKITGRTTYSLFKGTGSKLDAVTRDPFVAWPPKGFVSYPVAPRRWSINILDPQADVSNATVAMKRADGTAVNLTKTFSSNGRDSRFGKLIVWTVNDDAFIGNSPAPKTDVPVDVTIGNVVVNGQPQTITYRVTIIDANQPANDINLTRIPAGDITAGANVGTLSAYKFPRDFNTTTYTFTLVDGAGNTDNALFAINGATLTAAAALPFSTHGRYSIRVRVDDGRENGVFEKAIVVQPGPGRPADVGVTIALANGQAATGAPASDVNYTITVTNNAAFPVSNVVLGDVLPAGFTLSAADQNSWKPNQLYRYTRFVVDAAAAPTDAVQLQVAEIGMLDANGNQMDKRAWSLAFPDGQKNFNSDRAIDNDPITRWQAGGSIGAPTNFPYEITIDLGRPSPLTGFTELNGGQNFDGWAGAYRFFVSNDPQNWGDPVSQGTFSTDELLKTANFTPPQVPGQTIFTLPGPIAPGATATQNIVLTSTQTVGTFTNRATLLIALDDKGDFIANTNANAGSGTVDFAVAAPMTTTPAGASKRN